MKKILTPAAVALALLTVTAMTTPAGAAYRVCKLITGSGSHANNNEAHRLAVGALNRNRARHARGGYVTASPVARRGGRNSRNIWQVTFQQRMCRTR